jgi:exopolysaccharide biosynthesis polyprenyl glycosylphosphotransferase
MKRLDLAFTALFVPLDALAVVVGGLLAYSLRFSPWAVAVRPVQFDLPAQEYALFLGVAAAAFVVTFAVAGLYRTRPLSLGREAVRVVLASLAAMGVILVTAFLSRELFDSRFIFLAGGAFALGCVLFERLSLRCAQRLLRRSGFGVQRVAIIGKTPTGKALGQWLAKHLGHGYLPVLTAARFSADQAARLQRLARAQEIDTLLIVDLDVTRKELVQMKHFADTEHLQFLYLADLFPSVNLSPIYHSLGGWSVIEIPKTPLDGWGAIYKRLFDVLVGSLLFALTLPVQILVAVMVLIDSPGGIFFSRLPDGSKVLRVGQGGRPFHYFKFRSMQKDRHFERYGALQERNERKGPLVKITNDPRITRVGAFIRATSLDELPELWMVLMGRMSLVGPRPHEPEEVAKYQPEERRVLTVKPGMTGMAQVSGRASLDFLDEVALDMHYIENWSPWLDLIILLKTPWAVLSRKGAS